MAAGYRAAEIRAVALRNDAMNADLPAKPRVISIENRSELGPVGVIKPLYNTRRPHSSLGYKTQAPAAIVSPSNMAEKPTMR